MSQYFLFVNLDKKEYIEPRGGIKLRDLCTETANVIVAGDYGHTKLYDLVMEKGDESEWKDITEEAYSEFYEFLEFCSEDYHDMIAEVVNAIRAKNKDMR